ncbi:poly(A) RNA polymerase, mitochondrial isoform X1 [Trematomus bernacchii]|uniref:poly(A) RNA polymerase, mitochondrial isoform X1 n=1 Tax=Trematomus bernacchii TaxID=40690 RepID=UPI00146D6CA6|nr:poly(A) RNA polymerase, mitochondrial isoform X1 [Trematomus bernacchii]
MRISPSFGSAMASFFKMCRLHTIGRGSVVKCLQKVDTFLHRNIGTNVVAVQEEKNGFKSLYAVQAERQEQAERSVLISCHSMTNEKRFLEYLANYGDIQKYFFYGIYAVVEFANKESIASLFEGTAIPSIGTESMMPFKSRLLSMRNLDSVDLRNQPKKHLAQQSIPINELIQRLSKEESIDQQITSLTEAHQLTEESCRLRFLVCSLLKDIVAPFFPECTIKPFGSSVNGFGKLGCDLDMFLDLDGISGKNATMPKSGLFLEYQMKAAKSERIVTQNILSGIGTCMDLFGPGCVGLHKILDARCPLVRFTHQPSGFQCDLTANNRVAMKSTELLYLYGELDPRVRHLVFTVRCWAQAQGITKSIPGAWISNFSLTVMVLFFLQRRNPPIIPTLEHLRDLAGPEDKSVIEDNDCTFVSDFSKIQLESNTETLEQLLCEFFEFYASFSFKTLSINIRKGREQNKPVGDPLHIQNPFETTLNVSKNVNTTQLGRFVALCQESSWLIQQNKTAPSRGDTEGKATITLWGVSNLLLPSQIEEVKRKQNSSKKQKFEPTNQWIKDMLKSMKATNNQQNQS